MSLIFLILSEAWGALSSYRLRSFLTMLGVIVGVCAVILTLSIGEGIRSKIQSSLKGLGTNVLVVVPGPSISVGVKGAAGESNALTLMDAEAIGELSSVAAEAPVVLRPAQIVAGAQNWNTIVMGSTPDILSIHGMKITDGVMFTDEDVKSTAHVIVLGQTVANGLFPNGQAVGSVIRVYNNLSMRVIGVLQSTGYSLGGRDQDDLVVVPIKTAQRQLFGSATPNNVEQIMVSAKSARLMDTAQSSITDLLRDRKHLPAEGELPFVVHNLQAVVETAVQMGKYLSIFLTTTASISLIVGGIGIMNIMLVSVSERTREIGIRKALGATRSVILVQFLCEAVALSLVGCIIGIALGYGANYFVQKLLELETRISVLSVLISVTVAALTGILFGFFPALKASRMLPAEALRV